MKHLKKVHLFKICLLLVSLLMLQPEEAQASHFRYGNITWERVAGQPYQIRFKVTQSWRRSFYGSPNVGSIINGGTLQTGTSNVAIQLTITSVNVSEDWFYGEFTYVNTYPSTPATYNALFSSNARIGSPLQNNANRPFIVMSTVTVGNGNDAPNATLPPFISLPVNTAAATYQLPVNDPNNDALTFSLAPNGSFGSGTTQPGGLSVSNSGLITFNTIGKTVGHFYNTAIYVTDSKGARIQIDLMIRIATPSTPPAFDYTVTPANSTNYVLQPGQALSFNVKASDVDAGDNVALSAVGVPPGATFTPTSGNPVTQTFSWTPTIANVGTYQVNFTAQDNASIQTNTVVNIVVSLKPNFVAPSPGDGSIFCYTPGATITNTFTANDVDTADRVVLSLASATQSGMSFSPTLPTAQANPVSTNFTWNTSSSNWGINTVVVRATDTYSETKDDSIFYIINTPPVFATSQSDVTITAGQAFSYTFSGTDADISQGDVISLSHTHYPSWLSIVNNNNGTWTISGTPAIADSGDHQISLQLEDATNHYRGTHCGSAAQNFEITVLPCAITTSTVATNMSAPGTNDGAINLTVNNATSPVTYAWSNSTTTEDISALSAGTYTVNLTDANGCTATDSGTVYEPATALHFDGAGPGSTNRSSAFDYVTVPDNGTMDLGDTYTIESWIYLDDSANNTIIDKGNYRYLFETHPNGQSGLGLFNPSMGWIYSGGSIPIKTWVHVAVTFNATTGNVIFYKNGVVLSTHNGAVNPGADNGVINIGRQQPSNCVCNNMDGKMDELRVWTRELCQGEIQNNMNCELNPSGQVGLAALYHFNQGYVNANNSSVTTVTDASGNGNNGTLTSFALNGTTSNWTTGTVSGSCGTFVPPTATITASGPTTICSGSSVTLNANTGVGYSYQWYLNGSAISNATSASYTTSTAGNYTVDVTLNGCNTTSSGTVVTVNPLPTVNTVNSQTICANNQTSLVSFTGSLAGTKFKWTNNNTATGLAASGTGDIDSFTATNNTSSSITSTVTVTPESGSPGYAYIASFGNNKVDVVNRTTNTIVTSIAVGNHPEGISVSADGSRVYVSNDGSNSLSVINTATNTVINTISIGSSPSGVVVSPNGSRVYVANSSSNTVSVINTATNTVIATVNVGNRPIGVTITPDGSKVYVGNWFSNNVSVINTSTNTIAATIPLTYSSSIPLDLVASPDGSKVYVSNQNGNYIYEISTATNTISASINIGRKSSGITISPDGNTVYAADIYTDVLSVIDATTNTLTTTVAIGDEPYGVSISPDGSLVYINCASSKTVSVVSTATNTVANTLTGLGNSIKGLGNFVTAKAPICTGTPVSFNITVNPSTIITACASDITINATTGNCSAPAAYVVTATGASTPTMSYEFTGATTDSGSGTGSGSTFNVGTTNVRVIASDVCGNDTCTFAVTVNDTQVPVLSGIPADATVSCDAVPSPANVTATDNCSTTLPVTYNQVITSGTQPTNGMKGFWTFNENTGTTTADQTSNGNTGTLTSGVSWTSGQSGSAVQFPGSGNQYVEIPNGTGGDLDAQYSISMFAWYYPGSGSNPIIQYNPNGWGTHLWQTGSNQLFVRFTQRGNLAFTSALVANSLISNQWNCVGATYDYSTGVATLWCNGTAVASQNIGQMQLSTNYPVRLGSVNFDGRRTNSKVDNVLIYDRVLTSSEIGMLCAVSCPQNYTITRTWSATDAASNTTSATQIITVQDNTAPALTVPANIAINNDAGKCSAVATFAATATDNCSNNITITYSTASGTAFPVGVSTVNVTATDECGNTSNGSFTVTVTDNEAPVIACNSNISVNNDAGICGAVVTYTTPAGTDNCPNATTVQTAGLASGSTFPVGTTTNTFVVTDAHNNTNTCSFDVVVTDNEAPVITCNSNISVNNDAGTCGAVVTYTTPVGTDNCPNATTVQTAGLASGSTFPVGTTTNTFVVTDAHNNTNTCSFDVVVTDNEAPAITCNSNISVNNDAGTCGAVVTYTTPVGTDNCPNATTVQTAGLASGSTFPVGTTTNTFVVTDAHNNTNTCSFDVVVADNENPVATCKNYTLNLSGGTGTVTPQDVDNGSTDNCGIASMSVSPNTFTCADAGTQTVTLTVTDIHGNSSSCNATVTVQYQPTCTITTTAANNTYTGGNPNNIYLGYGSQSATVSCNATGGTGFTYSWSPATDLSCTNCQSPVFTPTAAGNYSYTVTATNSNGCATTCTVSFCVLDVQVPGKNGKSSGKVYLCHSPNGNPNNSHTLSISVNAVSSHLGNHSGDRLGSCDQSCGSSAKGGKSEVVSEEEEATFGNTAVTIGELKVYPNPNNGKFIVELPEDVKGGQANILDMSGRVIRTVNFNTNAKIEITLGDVSNGVYMVQVLNNGNVYRSMVSVKN